MILEGRIVTNGDGLLQGGRVGESIDEIFG
jgi:hypothetical protein